MTPKSTTNFLLGAILVSSLFFHHSAHCQSDWTGGTGNYSTAGNWNPNGVPTAATGITINSGTATFSGNLSRAASSTIAGGNLVVNGRFLNASGGPASFGISSGSLTQTGNYFIVGQNNAGSFTQTGGTVSATVDRGFFISDGTGLTSSLTVSAGSFSVNHNGSFTGYDADLHNTWIGRNGQNDSILINGGDFSVTNTTAGTSLRGFYITRDSSFRIDSGSATIGNMQSLVVGRTRAAGTSTFTVNGGTTEVGVNTAFIVGGGVNGSMSITGGTIDISRVGGIGGNFWIDDSSTTTSAIVNQTGGIFTIEGDVVLGRSATGTTATYTMSDGELHANTLGVGAHPNPIFQFLGGDIYLAGNQTSVIDQPWFNGTLGTTAAFDGFANQTHIFVIPEPASLTLVGLGALAFGFRRRRAAS